LKLPNHPASPDPLKRPVLWALALALAALAAGQAWALMRFQPPGLDFLPLWTAGRMAWTDPGRVYDFAAVTRAQAWLLPGFRWMRPYAYPPTVLLALAPLGALPFWAALSLWTGASFAVFAAAAARLARGATPLALGLAILSPAVVLAALAGQAVVMAAGLVTLAIATLQRRPRLAGVLFALAAALKPQAVLLAPIALVAGGAFDAPSRSSPAARSTRSPLRRSPARCWPPPASSCSARRVGPSGSPALAPSRR
jgi:hypothetical protein